MLKNLSTGGEGISAVGFGSPLRVAKALEKKGLLRVGRMTYIHGLPVYLVKITEKGIDARAKIKTGEELIW
jgi:hypothetical protein